MCSYGYLDRAIIWRGKVTQLTDSPWLIWIVLALLAKRGSNEPDLPPISLDRDVVIKAIRRR